MIFESADTRYISLAIGSSHESNPGRRICFPVGFHSFFVLCLVCFNYLLTKADCIIDDVAGQIGASPSIHVWDASTMKTLSVLRGFHVKGVCSLNFSVSGKLLLSVGLDDQHSVAVWRWQEGNWFVDYSLTVTQYNMQQKLQYVDAICLVFFAINVM